VGEVSLQSRRTPEQYQETIGSMLEEVNRLSKLVDNLLTISRADAGRLEPNMRELNVAELIGEVVAMLEVLADERQQTIRVISQSDFVIRADRVLLRQALLNVLDNAVKYSPVGGIITIAVTDTGHETLKIIISDSGPGIPNADATRIFDRFYRVDNSRTRETGGTGLGLAIARWAVVAQGGQIRLERSDQGATFAIEFPLIRQLVRAPADAVR
jgi:signal transduction histidine kinase